MNVRGEEVSERLPCLGVADEEGRNLIVEERAGDAARAVTDVDTSRSAILRALIQVALEVRCAVLVRVDLR